MLFFIQMYFLGKNDMQKTRFTLLALTMLASSAQAMDPGKPPKWETDSNSSTRSEFYGKKEVVPPSLTGSGLEGWTAVDNNAMKNTPSDDLTNSGASSEVGDAIPNSAAVMQQETLAELKQKNSLLEENIKTLEAALQERAEKHAREIQSREERFHSLLAAQAAASANTDQASLGKTIRQLQEQLDERTAAAAEVPVLQAQMNALKKLHTPNLEQDVEDALELKLAREDDTKTLALLKQMVRSRAAERQVFKTDFESVRQQRDEAVADNQDLMARNSELHTRVRNLEDVLNANKNKLSIECEKRDNKITKLSTKMNQLLGVLGKQAGISAAAENTINELNEDITKATDQISELKKELTELQQQTLRIVVASSVQRK